VSQSEQSNQPVYKKSKPTLKKQIVRRLRRDKEPLQDPLPLHWRVRIQRTTHREVMGREVGKVGVGSRNHGFKRKGGGTRPLRVLAPQITSHKVAVNTPIHWNTNACMGMRVGTPFADGGTPTKERGQHTSRLTKHSGRGRAKARATTGSGGVNPMGRGKMGSKARGKERGKVFPRVGSPILFRPL
jgi:hypothetical protein